MNRSEINRTTARKFLIITIWFLCLVANVIATSAYPVGAEPFQPADDGIVVARLPASGDASLRRLRQRWKADPGNASVAVDLARHYMRLERAKGDPRYLGYAQAALRPWWADAKTPVPVTVTRAQLLARRHAFDRALADLDDVLSNRPYHKQALLSRAFILQSQGKISEALASCRSLQRRVRSLISATCLARMESLSGKSGMADRRLTKALTRNPGDNPTVRLWALTNLAEIAWRRGQPNRAERLFREAISLDRPDAYLLNAYADLLLDLKRPSEVRGLLGSNVRADAHLLRLALSARALGDSKAVKYIESLASRFAASQRRGGTLHLREEARFELSLRNRPARALELALENWRTQREPADARLVLQAALAAGQPEEAGKVLAWLRRTGLEDRSLAALSDKIRGTVG